MRIAMIGPFGLHPKGTMRARALPLARALVARGHAVRILMPPWHTPEEGARAWEEQGVMLEYVSLEPRIPLLAHLITSARLVRRALAWQPEVIHCFKPKAYAGLAGWLLWHLRRLGLVRPRLVIDEDDWEGPGGWNELEAYPRPLQSFFGWQERWGLRHCDAVTVASRALQTLTWGLGVPPQRVGYLPNGAEGLLPCGNASTVRNRHNLGEAPVALLYTRFFEYDVARPVAVWRQVVNALPDARLLVVGKGLYARDDARFNRLVAEAGLGANVIRAGMVSQEQLCSYFDAADVALFPFDDTLVNRTKCSVKLVDLLAAGVPVVADSVGQNFAYIVHNESGLLVPSGDDAAMVEAVLRILQDKGLQGRLAAGARAQIAAHYTWAGLANAALAAYDGKPAP